MDADVCQACGGTGKQSDADSKKQPGRTLWMYYGPKGEGRLFKDMSQNALSNLEIEGWRDHPAEAIKASELPAPPVEKDLVDKAAKAAQEREKAAEAEIKQKAEDMRQAEARRKQEREEAEFQELLKQEKLAKQAKGKRTFVRKGK